MPVDCPSGNEQSTQQQPAAGDLATPNEQGQNDLSTNDLPGQPIEAKDWRHAISMRLREHLAGKLVNSIFQMLQDFDPSVLNSVGIEDPKVYARKVEKEVFEEADDKEDYYYLLAEQIYEIQRDIQNEKWKRSGNPL